MTMAAQQGCEHREEEEATKVCDFALSRVRNSKEQHVAEDDEPAAKRARSKEKGDETVCIDLGIDDRSVEQVADGTSIAPATGSTATGSDDDGIDFDSWDSDSDSESDSEIDCKSDNAKHDNNGKQPPRHPRKEETLILFDWDDTLLPSTWIRQQGLTLAEDSQPTAAQRDELKKISRCAASTLRAARRHGHVVLVTNAEHGWVQLSCRKFTPWLCSALDGIKILSARSEYEHIGVTSPFEWKFRAFVNEIKNWSSIFGADVVSNVISIGDAGHERLALLRAAKGMPKCMAKSMKLVERPQVPQLCKQHELLSVCLREIARHNGSLDLCFKF